MTVWEVMSEIERDTIFWDQSGGGATFSGGEPLAQPRFLASLLDACRAKRIDTVVETCGLAKQDVILELSDKAGLFLYDLKILDPKDTRSTRASPMNRSWRTWRRWQKKKGGWWFVIR